MHYSDEFVDAPWGKICVVRAGHIGKPVVLLHGIVDNAGGLQTLTNVIPSNFQYHIIELPGCGKSDPFPPGLPLHFDLFVSVVKAVVDHYKLDQFYFIGHSMGVQIGLLYNGTHPGKIACFVALDSLLYPPIEPRLYNTWYKNTLESYFTLEVYKKRTSPPENGPTYTYNEALALIMKTRGIPEGAARLILNRSLKGVENSDKFRFTWDQRIKQVITPAFTIQFQIEYFGFIQIPYLLILAKQSINKNVQLMNPHIMKSFFDQNPNFRFAIVDGNHDVHLTNTSVVSKYVSDFLVTETTSKKETDENFYKLQEIMKERGNVFLKSKI